MYTAHLTRNTYAEFMDTVTQAGTTSEKWEESWMHLEIGIPATLLIMNTFEQKSK